MLGGVLALALAAVNGTEGLEAGDLLQDCKDCPQMIVVPGGHFAMGAPEDSDMQDAKPMHEVSIEPFAIGRFEVTRAQFAAYVQDAGAPTRVDCWTHRELGRSSTRDSQGSWRSPSFAQSGNDPVVCVTWHEARAYVDWLSRKTGHQYRLLSESEWEYVARAGSTARHAWGDQDELICRHANAADQTAQRAYPGWAAVGCDDGKVFSAPVGTFQPNAWGVFDMAGNAWEWTQDCYEETYAGASRDGTPHEVPACVRRVIRGGSFTYAAAELRSANRAWVLDTISIDDVGLRVARALRREPAH